jgi:predicted nuclease of predicted toxin-antitoxin system
VTVRLLLDEHVGRVFERVLRERGYEVVQAKDEFGERTDDADLLHWCREENVILVTNNARDFRPLHDDHDHAGVFLFRDQGLPDEDPEGLARTIAEILEQYDEEVTNELVDLGEWYDWFHQ